MGTGPSGSPGVVTILCNTRCRWDAERWLTLTIVELMGNRIIARFRGEDPLVPWLLSRSQMTAVDDAGRTFPQLYDVTGDRDLENIVSVVFEGCPSLLAARRLAFHVEDWLEPLVSIDLPRFAETETEGKALEFG